jgi:gamma-glutamyltranspeptidase/glutathione hydrolase
MIRPSAAATGWLVVSLCAGLYGCRHVAPSVEPQPASVESRTATEWTAGVAAANPYAVDAGLEILRAGGSAADAAVAIEAVLGLVEPQSSGLGGGAFMLYYDAAARRITAFDGREMAPAGARPDMFLGADGQALSYPEAVTSGRATGTPGAIAMLGAAHEKFGRLAWSDVFGPAIRLASSGYEVPGRLGRFIALDLLPQPSLPDIRALFALPDGTPAQRGDHLTNPAYANTLHYVAEHGSRSILEGPLGAAIVERLHRDPLPGTMTESDLEAYTPHVVEPLCGPFLVYTVCVPPPPSSGVALLQMLGILERAGIENYGPDDPRGWLIFAEASRLMYADRDRYVADPAFIDVPVAAMLEKEYVASRARMIGQRAGPPPVPGEFRGVERAADATLEPVGTSHFVVIDAWGNVVSMTATVESIFGSGRVVGGFALNNQLTDFSFVPVEDDRPVANAVAGHKRPRSSMSPVIVFDANGDFHAALGSPGGSAILVYNAKALMGLLAWHLPLQAAIDLPNVYARGDAFYGEVDRFPAAVLDQLRALGVALQPGRGEESGLQGIVRVAPQAVTGAADPRREGIWRTTQ